MPLYCIQNIYLFSKPGNYTVLKGRILNAMALKSQVLQYSLNTMRSKIAHIQNSYKGAARCTKLPQCAVSREWSGHLIYCTQPYLVLTQEAVYRTSTSDLITWQEEHLKIILKTYQPASLWTTSKMRVVMISFEV